MCYQCVSVVGCTLYAVVMTQRSVGVVCACVPCRDRTTTRPREKNLDPERSSLGTQLDTRYSLLAAAAASRCDKPSDGGLCAGNAAWCATTAASSASVVVRSACSTMVA